MKADNDKNLERLVSETRKTRHLLASFIAVCALVALGYYAHSVHESTSRNNYNKIYGGR